MIEPSPTTRIDPKLARGVLGAVVPETATKAAYVVLTVPNTSYQLHLRPAGEIKTPVGKRVIGTIHARARRMDVVQTGGRFVEPVAGRPRRVQGAVVATDDAAGTVTVNAGVPIVCTLTDERQKPSQFEAGQVVGFDVLEGATFTAQR